MQDKIIAQSQHYLASGKTKEAIQLLLAHEIGEKNELVSALGRLNELGKKTRFGTATEPFITQEENSIRHAVLMQLDAVAFFEKAPKKNVLIPSSRGFKTWIVVLGLLAMLATTTFVGYKWGQKSCPENLAEPLLDSVQSTLVPSPQRDSSSQKNKVQADSISKKEKEGNSQKPDVVLNNEKKKAEPTKKTEQTPHRNSPSKSVSEQYESSCRNTIRGFSYKNVTHLVSLGECLFKKKPELGIARIADSVKESVYHTDGYEALSKYLILYNNYKSYKDYLPLFDDGIDKTQKDDDYKTDNQRIKVAKTNLINHFEKK